MIADDWLLLVGNQTANLPPRVVAELEFNSVIPPPDTIEEAQTNLMTNPH